MVKYEIFGCYNYVYKSGCTAALPDDGPVSTEIRGSFFF